MSKPTGSTEAGAILAALKAKALQILEHWAANPPNPAIGAELVELLTEARAMAGDDVAALEVGDE
jgi:hypothetical protein